MRYLGQSVLVRGFINLDSGPKSNYDDPLRSGSRGES